MHIPAMCNNPFSFTLAHGSSEELDFAPVFGTQVPDKEYERHNRQVEESEFV